jgi:hypothetical protein
MVVSLVAIVSSVLIVVGQWCGFRARLVIATPASSSINELVVEAARMSVLRDAAPTRIIYRDRPHVEFKQK